MSIRIHRPRRLVWPPRCTTQNTPRRGPHRDSRSGGQINGCEKAEERQETLGHQDARRRRRKPSRGFVAGPHCFGEAPRGLASPHPARRRLPEASSEKSKPRETRTSGFPSRDPQSAPLAPILLGDRTAEFDSTSRWRSGSTAAAGEDTPVDKRPSAPKACSTRRGWSGEGVCRHFPRPLSK